MLVEISQLENRLLISYAFITNEHICKASVIKVTNKIYVITIQTENNKKILIEKNMQSGYIDLHNHHTVFIKIFQFYNSE